MNTFVKIFNLFLLPLFGAFIIYFAVTIRKAKSLEENALQVIAQMEERTADIKAHRVISLNSCVPDKQSTSTSPNKPGTKRDEDRGGISNPNKLTPEPIPPSTSPEVATVSGLKVLWYWPLGIGQFAKPENNQERQISGRLLKDSLHLNLFSTILESAITGKKLQEDSAWPGHAFILVSTKDIPLTSYPPRDKQIKPIAKINSKMVEVIAVLAAGNNSQYILLGHDLSESQESNTLMFESEKGKHKTMRFKKSDLENGAYLVRG